jgi:hypothetical protein
MIRGDQYAAGARDRPFDPISKTDPPDRPRQDPEDPIDEATHNEAATAAII